MVVKKAINMARMMEVPILGLIENMGSMVCPHCGREVSLFGRSRAEEVAAAAGIPLLGSLPLDPALSALGDRGNIEDYEIPDYFDRIPAMLEGKRIENH